MGYIGKVINIPCGQGGIHSDDPQSIVPHTDLIDAINVTTYGNLAQKHPSSLRFNLNDPIPGGVMAGYDWWPDDVQAHQTIVVVGGDGKVYSVSMTGTKTEITAAGGAPATLSPHNQIYIVQGGNEIATNPRLLFIMDGVNPIQVISGTNLTRNNLSTNPGEWSLGNHPTYGTIHNNSLYVLGPASAPHRLYKSNATNHQDFTSIAASSYDVYPGEGVRLLGTFTFGGRMYLVKKPFHGYYVDDSTSTTVIRKAGDNFSCASAHSIVPVMSDVLIKNTSDQIDSVLTVKEFGDIKAGDLFNLLRMEQYMRDNTDKAGAIATHSLYYQEKKLVYFTYRSAGGSTNDRMIEIRVDNTVKPKITYITKDAPNCLFLSRDTNFIPRPFYGSLDGYIYRMDQPGYNVNGGGYLGSFQTPHMDFSWIDPKLAESNKVFDFIELRVNPLGNWLLFADIFIDGNIYETISFQMSGDALLADVLPDTNDFMLASTSGDTQGSLLAGQLLVPIQAPLHGAGRTISIRIYNASVDQGFQVSNIFIGFRPSGQEASVAS